MSPEIQKAMEHFSRIKSFPLTNTNGFFIVDADEYEFLSQFKFYMDFTNSPVIRETQFKQNVSNLILDTERSVDHKDRCIIDNRKKNLRKASRSQQQCNRGLGDNNTSGVSGVDFHKKSNKWRVRITKKGITYSLGLFSSKEEAIKARNEGAKKYHGRFAVIYPIN